MQIKKLLVIATLALSSLAATAADNGNEINEVADKQFHTKSYFPKHVAQSRDRLTFWKVFPYIVQTPEGKVMMRIRLYANPCGSNCETATFVVDEKKVTFDMNASNYHPGYGDTYFDFDNEKMHMLVQAVAEGKEPWVVVYSTSKFRWNIPLKDKQVATFKLMLDKYRVLTSKPDAQ